MPRRAAPTTPREAADGRRADDAWLRRALLRWYDRHARPLPWRKDRDPYRIWVAEVMLQQTRVAVVIPAYERFLRAFPKLVALARTDEERVLSLWSGLGYYSRARALYRAARVLVARGERTFPARMDDARKLPGVGAYTAAAVLSIAHDQPYAAVDANIARVLSRLECLGRPDARGEPHAELADRLLDRRRPGDWNQALMELGETVCLPRTPACEKCPIERACQARARGVVDRHPPPRPRRAVERLAIEITLVRDRAGRMLLERGAFAHLDHMWLPPIRILARPPRTRAFRHAILHRELEVAVRGRLVASHELARLARRPTAPGVERRILEPSALANLGRSSLLTKALRHGSISAT